MTERPLNIAASSSIMGGTYDDQTGDLTIEFVSGRAYTYHSVPDSTVRALEGAPSAGRFWKTIQDRYSYEET
jgi:hypothetical protein